MTRLPSLAGVPRILAFASVYIATVVLGRATRLPGTQLALVWPAVGVSVLWLASSWHRRAARRTDVVALFAAAVLSYWATDADASLSVVLGLAHVIDASVTVAVFHRLRPDGWRLESPRDLLTVVAGAAAGAIVTLPIGPIGVWALSGGSLAQTVGVWLLRNIAGVIVVAPVGLRLWQYAKRRRSGRHESITGAAWGSETALLIASSTAIHLWVFWDERNAPLVFLVVPFAVWAGLRLSTTLASVHVIASGSLIVGLTMYGGGPFQLVGTFARTAAAQALIAVIGVLTLLVALNRDQGQRLINALGAAHRETARQMEAASTARDRLASVLDAATEQSIIATNADGAITVFNAGAERMLGWEASEVRGRSVLLVHDEQEIAARAAEAGLPVGAGVLWRGVDRDAAVTRQWTYRTRTGESRQVRLSVSAMHEHPDDDRVTGYIGVGTDITAWLREQAARRASDVRFRLVFENSPVAIALIDLSPTDPGRIREANLAFTELTGYPVEALIGTHLLDLTHPEDIEVSRMELARLAGQPSGRADLEKRYLRADGSEIWGLCSGAVVGPDSGAPTLVLLVQDISDRKATEELLTRQASHDPLTGLVNRLVLQDRLEAALRATEQDGSQVALVYADLDGFKAVNDSVGHTAGDELLVHIAKRLQGTVRDGDTVARLGGDEFAIICPDIDPSQVENLVARITDAVTAPMRHSDGHLVIGVSLGVSVGDHHRDASALIAEADARMYAAKRCSETRTDVSV